MPHLSKMTGDGLGNVITIPKTCRQGTQRRFESQDPLGVQPTKHLTHHREPTLSVSRINLLRPQLRRKIVEHAQLIAVQIGNATVVIPIETKHIDVILGGLLDIGKSEFLERLREGV
jgi:hypothetical protein